MLHRIVLLAITALMLMLTACSPATTTPMPRPGIVTIEQVDLSVMESNPPQVQAHITGYLGDGCTTFAGITQQREGNTITITVSATHSGAEMCPAIAPLVDQRVMLEGPFAPGQYTVIVNGTEYQLTI
ncbi:hypothetical protein [Chloroflexus sp.]|uniref:hypothetical protein n=1 Tax=Chloroflexus sp. TaxID=1904827 RepID=UPI00298F1171|nr:hypothetical protein [Chloroflexus sp.]MCX7859918.1 hypothetical protein [Chloroflexus sp.]MDW8405783.1 hypothetical protein [Chloroflexus sp.]